jgi:hypothetical protein
MARDVGSSKVRLGMIMSFILLWYECTWWFIQEGVGWGGVGIVIIKFSSKRCTNGGLPNYYYYYYYYYPRLGLASTLTPPKKTQNKQTNFIFFQKIISFLNFPIINNVP